MDHGNQRVAAFAKTDFRNEGRVFGIRQADRRSHLYALGKTGTGKSSLLETLIRQDIATGEGAALFDPHGDLVERVAASVPKEREADLVYLDVPDQSRIFGFNPLERVPPERRSLAASTLVEVFKKIWADSWGPRLEHILQNAIFCLLEQPEATLADIPRLLDEPPFRKRAAERVSNAQVRQFWLREYESYPARFRAEAIGPLQNKVGAFLTDPILCRILSASKSSFDLRRVIDEQKILLVNLAKGRMGEGSAALLGALLVARLGLAGLSRSDIPEEKRRDFFLYIDEFQTFATMSFVSMLSELRKYRVNLTLTNQYLSQLDEEVRDSVLGNVGTLVSFRVGPADAAVLGEEFAPEFSASDLMSLPNYSIYVRLMIDGMVSKSFSAQTLRPCRPSPFGQSGPGRPGSPILDGDNPGLIDRRLKPNVSRRCFAGPRAHVIERHRLRIRWGPDVGKE
jgi:Type IV secretion-system coupling protein DNA-binding domain